MTFSANYFAISLLGYSLLSATGGSLYGNTGYKDSERIRFTGGGEQNAIIVDIPSNVLNTRISPGNGNTRGGIITGDLYGDSGIQTSPPSKTRRFSVGNAGAPGGGNSVGNIIKIATVDGGSVDGARYELAGAYRVNNREGVRDLRPVQVIPIRNGGPTTSGTAEPRAVRGDVSAIRIISLSGTDINGGTPRPGTVVYDLRDQNRGIVRNEHRNTNPAPLAGFQNFADGGIGINYNSGFGGDGGGAGNIIKIINIDGERVNRGGIPNRGDETLSSAGGSSAYGGSSSVNLSAGSSGTTGPNRRDANGNIPTVRINLAGIGDNGDGACAISGNAKEGENNGSVKQPVGGNPFIRISLADSGIGGNNLRTGYSGISSYSGVNGNGRVLKYIYRF